MLQQSLDAFLKHGYNVRIVHMNDAWFERAAKVCPEASDWLADREEHSKGKFYHSHLTDFARFCLLFIHGGVYSDMDALLLRPLDLASLWAEGSLFIGKDVASKGGGPPCQWCLGGSSSSSSSYYYLAPGLMGAREPGLPVLREALRLGFGGQYEGAVFNWAGPRAITKAATQKAFRQSVQILPQSLFYPVSYLEAAQLFSARPQIPGRPMADANPKVLLTKLQRSSTSLHLFGSMTGKIPIEDGSVVNLIQENISFFQGFNLQVPPFLQVRRRQLLIPQISVQIPQDYFNGLRVEFQCERGGLLTGSDTFERSVILQASNLATLNALVKRVVYQEAPASLESADGRDTVWISLTRLDTHEVVAERIIPVYVISRMVTVVVKTFDRMSRVIELVASLKGPSIGTTAGPSSSTALYPDIPILVGNDGPPGEREGPKRGFYYLPLPYDVGLSEGRNRLADRVSTDYTLFLDDDFVATGDSDLGVLVDALERGSFDLVAGKSPADQIDYSGRMRRVSRDRLVLFHPLIDGNSGDGECVRVDFVPNLFLLPTRLMKKNKGRRIIRWEPSLKLGEHEEFFYRAKKLGIRVGTCPTVSFQHNHKKNDTKTFYDQMRGRVFEYMAMALRMHRLKELIVFGSLTMRLMDLPAPGAQFIKRIDWYELQPHSVRLQWETAMPPYHYYQVEAVGGNETVTAVTYSRSSHSLDAQLLGLEAETDYLVRIRPANHTAIAAEGPTLRIRTPPIQYHSKTDNQTRNLLKNPTFSWSNGGWKRTLGALTIMLPVHRQPGRKIEGMVPGRPTLRKGSDFCMALYTPLDNLFSKNNNIANDPQRHSPAHPGYGIYQVIPAANLPSVCQDRQCILSVSGWARVDKIFGPPAEIDFSLKVGLHWSIAGTAKSDWFGEPYDPYEENRWQLVAFSIGVVPSSAGGARLQSIEVRGWLAAQRGAVFFDDLFLSLQPI